MFYTAPTEFNSNVQAGSMSIRPSRNYIFLKRTEKRQFLEPISIKSSTYLTFIFQAKNTLTSLHMLSLQTVTNWTKIAIANTYEVACDISIGIFIFDLDPF